MSDTRFLEEETEWPRRYTSAELHAIAKAAGIEKCGRVALEKLQRAAEESQWATTADPGGMFHHSNKEKRRQLTGIIKLCEEGAPAQEIQKYLDELYPIVSQALGSVRADDPQHLQRAAIRILATISRRGPDPKRARRQFIGDLVRIYAYATGRRPGRHFFVEEKGPFFEFVRAALSPFHGVQGCEADIKAVLRVYFSGRKESPRRRKNTVTTEH